MSSGLQRTDNTIIAQHISRNNWVALADIFTSAKGQIGNWGGRYCSQISGGSLYLEEICWTIFRHDAASPLKNLPDQQRLAAKEVLVQLRRIYEDTEGQLKNCSLATVVTRIYDFSNQVRSDGYRSGVHRLEDILGV